MNAEEGVKIEINFTKDCPVKQRVELLNKIANKIREEYPYNYGYKSTAKCFINGEIKFTPLYNYKITLIK